MSRQKTTAPFINRCEIILHKFPFFRNGYFKESEKFSKWQRKILSVFMHFSKFEMENYWNISQTYMIGSREIVFLSPLILQNENWEVLLQMSQLEIGQFELLIISLFA